MDFLTQFRPITLFSNILRKGGKTLSFLEITRPWNAVVTGLIAVFGSFTSGVISVYSGLMIFSIFTLGYMTRATVNDLADKIIDKINMPFRPLQEERVQEDSIILFSLFLHILSLLLVYLLGWKVFILMVLFLVLSFFYSVPPIAFSRRGILGQIVLSLTISLIPMYTGMVFSFDKLLVPFRHFSLTIFIFSLFIFVFLLKDFKDTKGEKRKRK